MTTSRFEWSIKKRNVWIATHENGTVLIACTQAELMSKINAYDLGL